MNYWNTHPAHRESSTPYIIHTLQGISFMLSVLSERIEISVYCFLGDAVCDKIYYDPYFLSHTIPRAWFLLLAPARCSQYVTGCFMSSAVHSTYSTSCSVQYNIYPLWILLCGAVATEYNTYRTAAICYVQYILYLIYLYTQQSILPRWYNTYSLYVGECKIFNDHFYHLGWRHLLCSLIFVLYF